MPDANLLIKLSGVCDSAVAPAHDAHDCAGFYGKTKDIDLVESEKVLRAALDSGLTLLNTADFYTGFEPGAEVSGNIKLIGEALHFLQ